MRVYIPIIIPNPALTAPYKNKFMCNKKLKKKTEIIQTG